MDKQHLFKKNSVTLKVERDGWGIIHDSYCKESYCINPVGAFIINLVGTGCKMSDLVDSINKKYGPLFESDKKDIENFIAKLRDLNIIST
jgi:hypothetical protein